MRRMLLLMTVAATMALMMAISGVAAAQGETCA
jgi:hypothetical protein